jgi:tetratricopeptide (TPR) repeat protein
MKYRDAIEMLDTSNSMLSGSYLAAFNRGNFNLGIADIIASIETQDIYSIEDNSTMKKYHKNALEDYNQSLEMNPEFIFSRFNRAIVYSLTDELEKAIEDYTWCIEQQPQLGEAHYNMGLLKVFMENPSAGCKDLRKAGELGIQSAYQVIYKFCKDE